MEVSKAIAVLLVKGAHSTSSEIDNTILAETKEVFDTMDLSTEPTDEAFKDAALTVVGHIADLTKTDFDDRIIAFFQNRKERKENRAERKAERRSR